MSDTSGAAFSPQPENAAQTPASSSAPTLVGVAAKSPSTNMYQPVGGPLPQPAAASTTPAQTSSSPTNLGGVKSRLMAQGATPSQAPVSPAVDSTPVQDSNLNVSSQMPKILLFVLLVGVLLVGAVWYVMSSGMLDSASEPVMPSSRQPSVAVGIPESTPDASALALPEDPKAARSLAQRMEIILSNAAFYRLKSIPALKATVAYSYDSQADETTVFAKILNSSEQFALWIATPAEGGTPSYSDPGLSVIEGDHVYVEKTFPGQELEYTGVFEKYVLTRETTANPTTPSTEILYEEEMIK